MKGNFWRSRIFVRRNVVIVAVLLFVCAAAYLNWSYNNQWDDSNSAMVEAEDEAMSAVKGAEEIKPAEQVDNSASDYFASARLTRQQSRDSALSLLETAASSQAASQETIDSAMNAISAMASQSLVESQIENELLAKDFADCVVYVTDDHATVVVPAPVEGLTEAAVARVTETVLRVSALDATQLNIFEVKPT